MQACMLKKERIQGEEMVFGRGCVVGFRVPARTVVTIVFAL